MSSCSVLADWNRPEPQCLSLPLTLKWPFIVHLFAGDEYAPVLVADKHFIIDFYHIL